MGGSRKHSKQKQSSRQPHRASPPSRRGHDPGSPRRGSAKRGRSWSASASKQRLVLQESGPRAEPQRPSPRKDTLRASLLLQPRQARQTLATLIAVTKNNQGEGPCGVGYCLAALMEGIGGPARLIRLVPGIGHFWSEEALPPELKDIHEKPRGSLTNEPQWQFRPVNVGFEEGSLPDAVTGPHRSDDIVSRNITFLGPIRDIDELDDQLFRISYMSLADVWPKWAWATNKALRAGVEGVASLAVFRGHIKWVTWRPQASPLVDLVINNEEVQRVPYAAHRLHDDKGFASLDWLQQHGEALLLLGLSRTFQKAGQVLPQCPILLLRVFPANSAP